MRLHVAGLTLSRGGTMPGHVALARLNLMALTLAERML
jgi:hypothetical protein